MFIRLNIAPFKFAMINHPIPLLPFKRFIKYHEKIDLKTDKRTVLQKNRILYIIATTQTWTVNTKISKRKRISYQVKI